MSNNHLNDALAYAQQAACQSMGMMQYSLEAGNFGLGIGAAQRSPSLTPMPVEPLPNKLLLLVEDLP